MTSRHDTLLTALRVAIHTELAHVATRYVHEALEGGDDDCCAHFGASTWRVARALGISPSEARGRLLDLAEAGRVLHSGRGSGHGMRWWPVGMAGELWECSGV